MLDLEQNYQINTNAQQSNSIVINQSNQSSIVHSTVDQIFKEHAIALLSSPITHKRTCTEDMFGEESISGTIPDELKGKETQSKPTRQQQDMEPIHINKHTRRMRKQINKTITLSQAIRAVLTLETTDKVHTIQH